MKRAEITKRKILETAELVFAEKGLYGSRVDEIADRAEVNKRMLYAYFGSKELLYVAVLEEVYNRLARWEDPLLSTQELDCEESICVIIRRSFEFLYQNPTFVKLVMWENLNEARYLQQSSVPSSRGASLEMLRRTLQRGIEKGIFRSDIDLDEMVLSINQFCFSYFSNIHTFGRIMQIDFAKKEEAAKRADHVADMILKYLK